MKNLKNLGLSMLSVFFLGTTIFAQSEVSDNDLETFVDIYKNVQQENQVFQQDLIEMVQSEGMEVQRFQEIQGMKTNPNADLDVSKEELETHEKLMAEIEKAQVEFQEKVTEMIEEGGMSIEKYQDVFAELQANEELQQKFSELIQG